MVVLRLGTRREAHKNTLGIKLPAVKRSAIDVRRDAAVASDMRQ
jgi:hypothetical protein